MFDIKSYIIKQVKFSVANTPSIPVNFALLYTLTEYLHLYYALSVLISFAITVYINFLCQKVLKLIKVNNTPDYISKLFRFYLGFAPSIFLAPAVVYLLVTYLHLWYMFANLFALIVTTATTFLLQLLLRVIRL